MKHIWEIKHSYYCSSSNYFSNEFPIEFESFDDFLEEWGDADTDYEHLFRWDWNLDEEDSEGNEIKPLDINRGTLELFYITQRKGIFKSIFVKVIASDENRIKCWLQKKWELVTDLWEGVSKQPSEEREG